MRGDWSSVRRRAREIFLLAGLSALLCAVSPATVQAAPLLWQWPAGTRSLVTQDYAAYSDAVAGKYHTGFDIAVGNGTPVYPAEDGDVVLYAIYNTQVCDGSGCPDHGDGNVIVLKHSHRVYSQYQHLEDTASHGLTATLYNKITSLCSIIPNEKNNVQLAYKCDAGKVHLSRLDQIGFSGNTGCHFAGCHLGFHLHFEAKKTICMEAACLLATRHDPSEWGYTAIHPGQQQYFDPSHFLDGATDLGNFSITETVTTYGSGFGFHVGPNREYLSSTQRASTGEVLYAQKSAPATIGCPGGWYDVTKTPWYPPTNPNPDFFPAPDIPGGHNLPEVWICRDDGTGTSLSPP